MSADFTEKEQAHVRAALHFLHLRAGRWATLGRALRFHGYNLSNIANGHRAVSAKVVLRIAKFAGVGLDDVLSGRFPAPGTCPRCGRIRN
jgi:plasmid maintenance system antidote protein VapI